METTKLIQRCTAPLHSPMGIRNPFAFGAGGGRLSSQALDLLAPVLNFDYMMAAEYEFGAVPDGLNKIRQHADKKLFFSTLDIKVKSVKLKSDYIQDKKREAESVPVYVIGAESNREEIERRVTLLATDEDKCLQDMWQHFKGKLHEGMYVRDSPLLNRYIKFMPARDRPIVGWLELDNGFFFSVYPSMTEKFAALFGLFIEIKTAK